MNPFDALGAVAAVQKLDEETKKKTFIPVLENGVLVWKEVKPEASEAAAREIAQLMEEAREKDAEIERLNEIISTRIQLGPEDKGDGVWWMIKAHWANEGYNKAASEKDADIAKLKESLELQIHITGSAAATIENRNAEIERLRAELKACGQASDIIAEHHIKLITEQADALQALSRGEEAESNLTDLDQRARGVAK